MTDPTQAAAPAAAATGAQPMPLAAILIPALLQASVQLAPLLEHLIAERNKITTGAADRADLTDAELDLLDGLIKQIQASIDAA
jgi:hypothetical protein